MEAPAAEPLSAAAEAMAAGQLAILARTPPSRSKPAALNAPGASGIALNAPGASGIGFNAPGASGIGFNAPGASGRPIFPDDLSWAEWLAAHPGQATFEDRTALLAALRQPEFKRLIEVSGVDRQALTRLTSGMIRQIA